MSKSAEIVEVVAFFRSAFAVIFALALAEGFKQFVFDRARQASDSIVDWEKLIPLLAFILLIFPFYQGTIRYFIFAYGDVNALPQHYSISIMIDSFAFMWEAALFFVMSRALAPAHWRKYYGAVAMLLYVDSAWGLVVAKLHAAPIDSWIFLNVVFGVIVGAMLLLHNRLSTGMATTIGFVAVLARSTLDYYLSWDFYFPR